MPASRDAATKADSAPTGGREPAWSPAACTAVVAAVALLALTAGIMPTGQHRPHPHRDRRPVAGSVAELIRVPIGGHDQAMMIRGTSTQNPVLLFLAGGPGGTELGAMRRHGQALEQDFVVVTWDQRGTGKSYDSLDPTSTLTLQQAVRRHHRGHQLPP